MKRRKLTLTNEESPDEEGQEKGQAYNEDDEDEDNENLDQFKNDGFMVDCEEEENNDQDGKGKQKKEKRRKKRSVKDLVLDADDIELLQENRISGICQFPKESKKFKRLKKAGESTKVVEQSGVSGDEGLLFGDIFGKEEAAYDIEEYEMANFILDDTESYRERSPLRSFKKNLKRLEQVVTICSTAENDVSPVTGVANESLNHQKQVLAINVKLEGSSEFEPFFLADKYMTERDNHVRVIDMPERMQVIEEITGPPPLDEMSREEESAWILNQLVMNSYLLFCKKTTPERSEEGSILLSKIKKEDVMKFLELHHVEKFDIPFIAMYRKEQCLSLLEDIEQDEAEKEDSDDVEQACQLKWHKVLWVIKQLDTKWLLLQKRKRALHMYQKKRYEEECLNIDSSERFTLNKQLFESISKSLNKAESKEEIDDVDTKFSLHFPSVEERIDGKYKRPTRKSQYSDCMKAGLWELACRFGYTSEQLGLQIALEEMDVELQGHPDESPDEMALKFTCAMFETPELVLKGARHMAALEMSCEPCIKKHIRCIFMDKAVVTTSPTLQGNVTIDCYHQFSGVKWLHEKPLSKFNDAQWLLIQKAEEEKLLQVSIKLPESTLNELITGYNAAYLINGAGRFANLWKEHCKLIVDDAFNFLLPSMEKEARNLLTSRAKHWLLMEYGKELWKMVSVGPYSNNKNSSESTESVAPKVMSCCWGSGKPPTFVMLDSTGELLDVLEARSINLRSETIDDQQRKKNDWQRVFRFMKNHQPHVIVIGAANASCVRLKENVKEIVSILEENLRDLGQDMNEISVVYGDESLPQLYEHSGFSSDQLPGQSGIVKRAVALGRYLQNPLAMVATLCGDNREIVSWKLCPLEEFLTPDEKYELIEQVMVDVTNQVGFDVNFAVSHNWYFPLLQFVSGLGPQKASFLQRKIVAYSAVNNRRELANFGLNTKKVFHNAVGFLCIRGGRMPCSSFDIDLLDCTRIHPESYELAERLAKAVCNDIRDSPIEYVTKEPQVLSAFDINDYLDNNEIEEGENRRENLNHIKKELLHGFLDPRKPYKVPSLDEEFNMICSKNRIAPAEGRLVQAIVRHVRSDRAFCVLDSGLTGIIMKDDFSDKDDDFSLEEKLHEGDKVSCIIKQIDKSRYQAFLTCKASEMKSRYKDISEVDPYYYEGASTLLNLQEKACLDEKLGKKNFKPRIISHPCFRNMTMDLAMEFLSEKDVGESIFRPSSRGLFYLTLTLKVFDELYANKDIVESGKDDKDITSLLHIGKTLKIGDYTFGDLDEVMDRYVAPLVKHLKEMLGFRKFKRGSKAEVDEVLRAEKSEYPMRVVYYFGVSYEHPGTFILSYIRSKNLHHEYVGLLPNGFKFRKEIFEKIEQLVRFFQKNIDDLQRKSPTLANPEIGNSSGPYIGGGWRGQFNNSGDRSVSRGRNGRDGTEDREKKHPSGIPRPHNGPGHVSSNDATKWGNDIDFAPKNEGFPSGWRGGKWDCGRRGSGGNWDTNDGVRNSEWSKESGNNGPWGDPTCGWDNPKNGGSGGSYGVWHASGSGYGYHGGERDHGPGSVGGGRNWGGTREGKNGGNFGSTEGVWHASGNNVAGRGLCGGTHGWGGTKESESSGYFASDEGVWHAAGSSSGRRRTGDVRDQGPGGGYGGRSGSKDSCRGGRSGCARNGRGSGRRGGHSDEMVDNRRRESEFGRNSSNWGCNEDRNWSHAKRRDFHGDSTYGNWGCNNDVNDEDKNDMLGKRSGSSWNCNTGACVSGSSWKHREGVGNGGNRDSGGWANDDNNNRPESWGGHVAVNRRGWSSGNSHNLGGW